MVACSRAEATKGGGTQEEDSVDVDDDDSVDDDDTNCNCNECFESLLPLSFWE